MSRTVVRIVLIAAVIVIVSAIAWVGSRAAMAKTELESAVPLASRLRGDIVQGNSTAARRTFSELAVHAANAAALTSDPVWQAFESVPLLGSNFTAVRQLAGAVNHLSQSEIKPLDSLMGSMSLSELAPVHGAIQLQPLLNAEPNVAAASAALKEARNRVHKIDVSGTLSIIHQAAERLATELDSASEGMNAIHRATELLPAMLGSSGDRNYVLLFQNPAELRATGGISGAIAMIHTSGGKITLTKQASSSSFPHYTKPVLPLPLDTRGMYGDIPGEYIQDVNLTPDFPQSAQLAREMWRRQFGVTADGVLSIDPVALSYVLSATGPIKLPDGEMITSDNALKLLLSDVYARYPNPHDQDEFFAGAASAIFGAVSNGNVNPKALLRQLLRAGSEHRALIWSAHPAEQRLMASTTLTGGLPVRNAAIQRFGVYLNDGTGAKMDYYLKVTVGAGQITCRGDRRPNYGVTVTLANTVSPSTVPSLPSYVSGAGIYGVRPGDINTVVSVYGVPSMQNLGVTRDGSVIPYHPTVDQGYPVSSLSVDLAPGKSTTLAFSWLGSAPFSGKTVTEATPAINISDRANLDLSCKW